MYSLHATSQFALTHWHFTQHAKVSHESDHKTWELLSLASPMQGQTLEVHERAPLSLELDPPGPRPPRSRTGPP